MIGNNRIIQFKETRILNLLDEKLTHEQIENKLNQMN